VKFFTFFYHRASCPKQFDPFKTTKKTTKKKQNNKKNKIKKVGRLSNDLFLDFYISL